ncbi:MAG TPA: hypothetical protein VKW76_08055 [Candidatus Binatia bacterium]|nr:hypothetical protein [Candidatus Binatia bacterium]
MRDRDWMLKDERFERLFEPETMLPTQFFGRVVHRTRDSGERRLMAAILEDAVHTMMVYDRGYRRGPRELREARRWIESRDRRWIFSFERICEALDIDATCLRRALRARAWRLPPRVAAEVGRAAAALGCADQGLAV